MSDHAAADESPTYVLSPGLNRLADHWGLVLTYGLVTLALGIVLIVWPDATVTVFVVLLAIQLIVAGVFRISRALSTSRADGGVRALVGLSGGIALIVGLLILRDPLQTVVVLGLILGAWWVVAGVVDIIGALISPRPDGRGWEIFAGVVSVLAGGFLLVYTDLSLRVLVVFVAIWLILAGILAIAAALTLRARRTATT
jgi:uncharacterized membrane protein HdeD (DUF308 family)